VHVVDVTEDMSNKWKCTEWNNSK